MAKRTAAMRGAQTRPLIILLLIALCALILGYAAQYLMPLSLASGQDATLPEGEAAVHINEVMSANASAFADDNGLYSDWLEIINEGDVAVDLSGWTITLSSNEITPFTFSEQMIEPGECLLIIADGKAQNTPGYIYHAPFKLPASGEVSLTLRDRAGLTVDSVELPSLEKNQVYLRTSGGWEISGMYTPSLPNEREYYEMIVSQRVTTQDDIELSEVMSKNATYARSEYGEYVDWIEIHNTSSRAVNLAGYSLSDSGANLKKWIFPDCTVQAGGYLIIYADGRAQQSASALHTSFSLDAGGEELYLCNPDGQIVDSVTTGALNADQSLSKKADGSWTNALVPTPGYENTALGASLLDASFRASSSYPLYISEVMAYTDETDVSERAYDWLEIYNAGNSAIDLSGFGLSDSSSNPRKWQFPSGVSIGAGEYMIVHLSGENTQIDRRWHTSFSLSSEGGYTLSLCDANGAIIDRLSLPEQYCNISYGRQASGSDLGYFDVPTAGAGNTPYAYEGRCDTPSFSVEGGLYDAGETLTITLSAPQGQNIYYTLDCTDPTTSSTLYTGPITISANTIVRAVCSGTGMLPSYTNTQSYFFGLNHTMRVVSLVSDPANLFDYYTGIYEMGPNATSTYPYGSMNKGANFWMDWEKAANVEIFSEDGETLLSDPCGIKLHGQYSRAEDQKAFKVIARSKYGSHRFEEALFDNREYTEYQSFVLRASGQDTDKTRMRDSVLASLAEGTGVMYQETELCVVYLNGEYWGHYNIRERINTYSITQWEGWSEEVKDDIDLIKANRNVMQGSNEDFVEIIDWIKENGVQTEANLAYVEQHIDVDNYLNYVAIQMYTANPDLLNVKRYKCDTTDGKWRWILFDMDWAFYHNSNSITRWLNPDGVGTDLKTDNTLFVELMKSPVIEDRFLTILGELMATNFSTETVLAKINERYEALLPEMPAHQTRWGLTMEKWEKEVETLREYARTRPGLLLGYIQDHYDFTDAEMEHYFGDAMRAVEESANS